MPEFAAKRNPKRCPAHPGELIADLRETNHLTKSNASGRLDISRQLLQALLAESKPVTPEMAARLGKFLETARASGFGCRQLMTHGTWSARSTPVI